MTKTTAAAPKASAASFKAGTQTAGGGCGSEDAGTKASASPADAAFSLCSDSVLSLIALDSKHNAQFTAPTRNQWRILA